MRDAQVAIVGAGPQGLTAAVYLVHAGLDPDDLAVFDPAGDWLAVWKRTFDQLGIAHLRSPAVHHPHPDPYALRDMAEATGRSDQLFYRYGLPATSLFEDFCAEVIAEAGLRDRVEPHVVVAVDDSGELALEDGRRCRAAHVVWATNPSIATELPGAAGPRVITWSHVDRRACPSVLAVVGGGLTAAHLVQHALAAGSRVEWVTRRPIVEREFDTDPGWLGPKEMRAFSALGDPEVRLRRVLGARGGGSVPSWMLAGFGAAGRSGQLRHHCGAVRIEPLDDAAVRLWVGADPLVIDEVWLATGSRPSVGSSPALAALCHQVGAAVVQGRPVLDPWLRLPGTPVHVLGRLAELQLGPTAGNLSGARRAAEVVVGAVLGEQAMFDISDH